MRYIKFDVKIHSEFAKPEFIGSMIRGAFGVACKRVFCLQIDKKCIKDDCFFCKNFEGDDLVHFKFDFMLRSKEFAYSLVVFEPKESDIPYIISALYLMLSDIGLGVDRVKISDFDIMCGDDYIFRNGKNIGMNYTFSHLHTTPKEGMIYLNILTPIRMRKDGKAVRENLELSSMLKNIGQRYNHYTNQELRYPNSGYTKLIDNTYFHDITRYSNRQKTKMGIGGILGHQIYKINEEISHYLQIGKTIGVGKQTSFGLGKIDFTYLE